MSRARLASNQGQDISASAFEKETHGEVVCFWCRCRVKGVRAYSKTVGNEIIIVPAYFSLWPNVQHSDNCRFNIEETVKRFVANSQVIRRIGPNAVPILSKVAQGQAAEFRLHILMEALQKQTYGFGALRRRSPQNKREEEPLGHEYIRTDEVLKPYFRTAKGILALAARIQSHQDLSDWIRLKFGDRRITWDEFLFDSDGYHALYNVLLAERTRASNARYPRPVALVARIFKESSAQEFNGEFRLIGTNRVIVTPAGPLAIRPVFYFRDQQLAEDKRSEEFLLVCGLPKLSDIKPPIKLGLNPRVDVSIKIVDPRQICRYTLK